ncbi:hypothetical protein [Streptomyces sp. NPDC048277]|uniref:hypothetical protein n=1 Tax=Streptomyces sp. NPDC048277 TaxID=3155027 RepID=UPI0033CCC55C
MRDPATGQIVEVTVEDRTVPNWRGEHLVSGAAALLAPRQGRGGERPVDLVLVAVAERLDHGLFAVEIRA